MWILWYQSKHAVEHMPRTPTKLPSAYHSMYHAFSKLIVVPNDKLQTDLTEDFCDGVIYNAPHKDCSLIPVNLQPFYAM